MKSKQDQELFHFNEILRKAYGNLQEMISRTTTNIPCIINKQIYG